MNRIEEGIEAFGNNVSKATVPDIETLKGLKYLAVGDIVQLNGYYQAGDGAHHKRKIESADDGSGVQLANGLWANIVHNGEVHFKIFGGKNGSNSNYIQYHTYCDANNIIASYQGMSIVIDTSVVRDIIIVKNPVIFECDLKVDRKVIASRPIFRFLGDTYQFKNLDLDYGDYSDRIIGLDVPDSSYVRWYIPDIPYEVGISGEIYEHFIHVHEGITIGKSFAPFIGNVKVYYRPINNRGYDFKNINLEICEYESKIEEFYFNIFEIRDLDNITIENFILNQTKITNSKSIFSFLSCSMINIKNFVYPGIDNSYGKAYGYGVTFDECIDVNMDSFLGNRDISANRKAWSSYGANRVKKMCVRNSNIYRYDNHSFIQDLYAENNVSTGSALSGNGFRKFIDCTFIFSGTGYVTETRGNSNAYETNGFFDGEVLLKNCTIHLEGESDFSLYFVRVCRTKKSLKDTLFNRYTIDGLSITGNPNVNVRFFNSGGTDANKRAFHQINIMNCDLSLNYFGGIFRESNVFSRNYAVDKPICLNVYNSKFRITENYQDYFTRAKWCTSMYTPLEVHIDIRDCSHCNVFNSSTNERSTLKVKRSIGRGFQINEPTIDKTLCYFEDVTVVNPINSYATPIPANIVVSKRCEFVGNLIYNDETVNTNLEGFILHSDGRQAFYGKYFSNRVSAQQYANILEIFLVADTQKFAIKKIDGTIEYISTSSTITNLDTPYMTSKMQQEGIYEDFIQYMDEKTEYDRLQRELEQQRQLAFESREDQEQTYEEWLATQPVLIPDNEPQPSQKLLEFYNEYK